MALTAITVEGVTLTDNARNIKVMNYGTVKKRGTNLTIPHRDGEWSSNPKWLAGGNLILEVMLKTVPSPEENLSDIIAAFNQADTTSTITGTHEFAGAVRCEVEMLNSPAQSPSNPNVYRFVLRNPKGSWESVTATSSTGNSGTPAAITTSGDTPIDDFTILYPAGAGYVEHTRSDSVVARATLEAGASTGTTVDMGNRTVLTATGGAQDAYLAVTQPYWMRFDAGSTQAITASVNHTITWRSKWAV